MPGGVWRRIHVGIGAHPLVNMSQTGDAKMIFSPMRGEDLDAVMEIERQAFPQPWTPGLFLHELKLPFSKTILARVANGSQRVLGYVCRWLVGDEAHILNLAVHPERRRVGIGRALIELVLQEAQQQGARTVTLEVRRENTTALALYRSLGFTERGVRRNYYGRGQDAIIMGRATMEGREEDRAG